MRARLPQILIAVGVVLGLVGIVLIGMVLRQDRERSQRAILAEQAISLVDTAISAAPPGAVEVRSRERTTKRVADAVWAQSRVELDAQPVAAGALREHISHLVAPLGLTLSNDGEWEEAHRILQRWSVRERGEPVVHLLVRLIDAPPTETKAAAASTDPLVRSAALESRAADWGGAGAAPLPEVSDRVLLASVPPAEPWAPVLRPCPPQAAIIIDDVGYVWSTAKAFLAFDRPLTLAVFPNLEFSERIAERAQRGGREILMHLPMESEARHVNPHTLRGDMSQEELLGEWAAALRSLPGVVGVNNHQGSIMTADAQAMERVLRAVNDAHLFFIDSRTTVHTVARQTAEDLGVPTNENDLFLDNVKDVEYIKLKCRELVTLALEEGEVIGIAHAHPATLQALQEVLPEFDAAGVQLVYASALVD